MLIKESVQISKSRKSSLFNPPLSSKIITFPSKIQLLSMIYLVYSSLNLEAFFIFGAHLMSEFIRFEKTVLIAKRLVVKELVEFSDQYFTFIDKINQIAQESGLEPEALINWAKSELDSQLGFETTEDESN